MKMGSLIATKLSCSRSIEVPEKFMATTNESSLNSEELVDCLKTSTVPFYFSKFSLKSPRLRPSTV